MKGSGPEVRYTRDPAPVRREGRVLFAPARRRARPPQPRGVTARTDRARWRAAGHMPRARARRAVTQSGPTEGRARYWSRAAASSKDAAPSARASRPGRPKNAAPATNRTVLERRASAKSSGCAAAATIPVRGDALARDGSPAISASMIAGAIVAPATAPAARSGASPEPVSVSAGVNAAARNATAANALQATCGAEPSEKSGESISAGTAEKTKSVKPTAASAVRSSRSLRRRL
jgi:hypothetical protein